MSGVKISALPAIVTPALTDIFPVVQSGVTYKETMSQLLSLYTPVPVVNGGTGLTSTVANEILYSSSANTIAGLPTANNGILVTSAGGVPSIATALPAGITGYTVANLSDVAWTSYAGSITYTGFAGTPTTNVAKFKQIGKTVFVVLDMTGTSNATTFGFSLPVTGGATGCTFTVGRAEDNGTYSAVVYGAVPNSGTSAGLVINDSGSGWTNAGTKGVRCSFFYESV
jgi:hypothetical protein